MELHELSPLPGARKKVKRVGRGTGSGHGKTATRGMKGQGSRSGGTKGKGFEGGQQPLIRRIPKRGFYSLFRRRYVILNLQDLSRFDGSRPVTPELLKEIKMIRRSAAHIKILGQGAITCPLTIRAHKFSEQALKKITEAGGKGEVIQGA